MTMPSANAAIPALVLWGEPSLMRRQTPVDQAQISADAFQQQLDVLRAAMHHYGGIGIAAPQIGWDARVFCLGIDETVERYPDADPIPFQFWINPRIVEAAGPSCWTWEGCLSVPGLRGWVERPSRVKIAGIDEFGDARQVTLEGFAARIFQHEYDHLDGVVYPQRVTRTDWLVSEAVLARRDRWRHDWPSPGARHTRLGELSPEA